MKKTILILSSAFLLPGDSFGAVFSDAVRVSEGGIFGDGDWDLIVSDPVSGEGGHVRIDFEAANFLSAITGTIAAGYEWSLVTDGTILDPGFFLGNAAFASNFAGGGFQPRFMTVSGGDQFTWGHWVDVDYNSRPNGGDLIGWARFEYQGVRRDHPSGLLRVIESYSENSGSGMVVGQMAAIPEPSAAGLLGGALLVGIFLARRRD